MRASLARRAFESARRLASSLKCCSKADCKSFWDKPSNGFMAATPVCPISYWMRNWPKVQVFLELRPITDILWDFCFAVREVANRLMRQ